jgi:hypothetical protein
MRKTLGVLVLALSIAGSGCTPADDPPGAAAPSDTAAPALKKVIIEDFNERVAAYVRLRKSTENSFVRLTSSKDPAVIEAHKIELASMLISARPAARQGDIFTPAITAAFRDIIRKTVQSPDAQAVRRTVHDKDPEKFVAVRVNIVYSEDNPLQTTSPTLLGRLPELPMDLGYRFIGRAFVLLDNKTRLIVDFIPDALP